MTNDSNQDDNFFRFLHVDLVLDTECIPGTFFLLLDQVPLNPQSGPGAMLPAAIQWIADSDTSPHSSQPVPKPPMIPLDQLEYIERKQHRVGVRCAYIILHTHEGKFYGPFEFKRGGSSKFLEKVGQHVDLQR